MRFYPADTANFLRMARASLGEVQTHLERGRRRGYWEAGVFERASKLCDRTLRVTTGFMNERLEAAEREKRTGKRRRRRRPRRRRAR
jgi:four helix bundle protein